MNPTDASRGSNPRIFGHSVTIRTMLGVGPFIHLFRPRLPFESPLALRLDAGDTQRTQDTHYLVRGNLQWLFANDDVYEVVRVGEILSVEELDGDAAIQSERQDVVAGFAHGLRACVKPMYQITIVQTQRRRDLPVSTTNMNDYPTLDTAGCDHLLGQLSLAWYAPEPRQHNTKHIGHTVLLPRKYRTPAQKRYVLRLLSFGQETETKLKSVCGRDF